MYRHENKVGLSINSKMRCGAMRCSGVQSAVESGSQAKSDGEEEVEVETQNEGERQRTNYMGIAQIGKSQPKTTYDTKPHTPGTPPKVTQAPFRPVWTRLTIEASNA